MIENEILSKRPFSKYDKIMADPMQDLDVFLTAIESKLRTPFSSLELAKAVQNASLRSSSNNSNNANGHSTSSTSAAAEYLDRLSQVLHRTDKITQLRILVGLMNINSCDASRQRQQHQQDESINRILTQAQEAPLYDDWVRVIAGIVQGIMFDESDEDSAGHEQHQAEDEDYEGEARATTTSCRGKEANDLLEKMCKAIIDQVCELEQATTSAAAAADGAESSEETADADPTFAPFRYALLHSDLLHQAIPETKEHAYFQINESASILHMDAKLDRSKVQEEKEHNMSLAGNLKGTSKSAAATAASSASTAPTFPGFRSSSTKTAAAATAAAGKARPKSSMFLAPKKPTAVTRTALHTRKKGAAQALVGKGRSRLVTGKQGTTAAGRGGTTATTATTTAAGGTKTSLLGTTTSRSSTTTTATVRGRALNATTARSKMKMIDVQEVQGLAEEQKEREGKVVDASSSKKKSSSLLGQKRKAAGPAAIEPKAKKAATTAAAAAGSAAAGPAPATPAATTTDGALVSAALSAYQSQVAAAASNTSTKPKPPPPPPPAAPTPPATKQQDWREMLKEKSNRLSAEDRFRIQQFFNEKFNPTPDQPTYKMKLHERRTTDPKTGEPVKETFYLELDYTNFTSKQSKKTKRYSNDAA